MRRLWYELLACGLAAAALIAVITSPASGKAASDDVNIVVYLGTDLTQTKTSGLSFRVSVGVFSGTGVPQAITVRIALPAGLAWGRDAPDPTEGCVGDAPAVCKQTMTVNQAGTVGFGWIWDVVAAAPGSTRSRRASRRNSPIRICRTTRTRSGSRSYSPPRHRPRRRSQSR
jgi:hypothetical protein